MRALALILALAIPVRADFATDRVPVAVDIVSKIVTAANAYGDPLRSTGDEHSAYYLRSADYLGECQAFFGTVHVARLSFTRSGTPARGHSFIVFLDSSLRVRAIWRYDGSGVFSVDGTRLRLNDRELLDFSKPSTTGTLVVDGEAQAYPVWK